MDEIVIVPYDPTWPARFAREAELLRQLLPAGLITRIDHFGSTAVPGLSAKPIIDMLIGVRSLAEATREAVPRLEAQGYSYWAANPRTDRMFLVKGLPPNGPRTHHLHLIEPDHPDWERLLFRDYLRAHPDEAARYAQRKDTLAAQYRDDREAYTAAKGVYIAQITTQARRAHAAADAFPHDAGAAADTPAIHLVAISGSLRAASANTAALHAAATLAPAGVTVAVYTGLADLPHFNPDLDIAPAPLAVESLRSLLRRADGVLLCTPEYAHGLPGSLKNALDWVVSSGEFVDKPVGLINVAPRATYAQAALRETLTVMTAQLVAEACVTLPLTTSRIDTATLLADWSLAGLLAAAVAALAHAAAARAADDEAMG